MKHILIIGGGPVDIGQLRQLLSDKPDYIIAADKGGQYLLELRVKPDELIGDFDSLPATVVAEFGAAGVDIAQYPVQKDQTDLELALDRALIMNPELITILGGIGGRFDHTLANLGQIVRALQNGVRACLIDPGHEIWVTESGISLTNRPGWAVSLLPLTPQVVGVTLEGMEYPLVNAKLVYTSSLGLHNRIIAEEAFVELKQGTLAVILFRED